MVDYALVKILTRVHCVLVRVLPPVDSAGGVSHIMLVSGMIYIYRSWWESINFPCDSRLRRDCASRDMTRIEECVQPIPDLRSCCCFHFPIYLVTSIPLQHALQIDPPCLRAQSHGAWYLAGLYGLYRTSTCSDVS